MRVCLTHGVVSNSDMSTVVFRADAPLLTFYDPRRWISLADRLPCQSHTLHIISVLFLMTSVQNPGGNHSKCGIFSVYPCAFCQLSCISSRLHPGISAERCVPGSSSAFLRQKCTLRPASNQWLQAEPYYTAIL